MSSEDIINQFIGLPNTLTVLRKLFKIVNAEPTIKILEDPFWSFQFKWTSKDEKVFKTWMEAHLRAHKDAREELMTNPELEAVKGFVEDFCDKYGWAYSHTK